MTILKNFWSAFFGETGLCKCSPLNTDQIPPTQLLGTFFLSSKLKIYLKGKRFEDMEGI